jgi:non-specific serine/threonine protein kinase
MARILYPPWVSGKEILHRTDEAVCPAYDPTVVGGPESAILSTFVGRQVELEQVRDLLRQYRLVTLVGVGGLGKTRLADKALENVDAELEGTLWRVELADLTDPGLLNQRVAERIEAAVAAVAPDLQSLSAHIGDRPALILLDNCEHLVEACAGLVGRLLAGCPGLKVLATSRQPLGLLGEQLYPVPQMARADGVGLFEARAASQLPTWGPGDDDVHAIAELCDALEGIPLAIELAAVQIRRYSPSMMRDQLRAEGLPGPTLRGEPARRSSLEACVRWSYDLCTAEERALWSRLSVFAGPFSASAAQSVCSGQDLDRARLLDALSGLVDKSVVDRLPDDADGRFRMLEIIRQFGRDQLRATGELELWRGRHLDHYVEVVERFAAELMGPDQAEWMRTFRAERTDLTAALERAVSSIDGRSAALRMAPVLEHYYASTGGGAEAIRWIQLALGADGEATLSRANALRVGSFIASIMARIEDAEQFLRELQELSGSPSVDDDTLTAMSLYAESVWRAFSGDAATGEALAAQGIELLHRLGEDWLVANLLFLRGLMLGWADRPEEAAAAYRACIEIGEPHGERWLTSYSAWGLGLDALIAGRVDEAVELERDALRAKAEFHDALGIGLTIVVLAWAAAEHRRGREAALLLGAAEAIWNAIGMTIAAMPYVSRRRDEGIAETRKLLAPHEFDQLVADGRALPQDQAVAIALGDAPLPRDASVGLLTRREREIARQVADGASNRAIAERLVISVRTVESHVESLMRKLGVSSRTRVAAALADETAPTDGP